MSGRGRFYAQGGDVIDGTYPGRPVPIDLADAEARADRWTAEAAKLAHDGFKKLAAIMSADAITLYEAIGEAKRWRQSSRA